METDKAGVEKRHPNREELATGHPRFKPCRGFCASGRRPFKVSNVLQHRRISSSAIESHGRAPLCIGRRAFCHCSKYVVAAKFPDWLELAGRTLRKVAEDIGSADAERYQQTSERGWCQLESGSSFECRRGQAGPEAERTGSELAMTRLVASPRREVLCPVRQSFSPGCAAEDLHQTALCDHLRRTRARRSNRELSSG